MVNCLPSSTSSIQWDFSTRQQALPTQGNHSSLGIEMIRNTPQISCLISLLQLQWSSTIQSAPGHLSRGPHQANYLPYSTPYTKTNAPCQNHLNLNSIGMSDWDMWWSNLSLSLCCSSLMIFTSMMWDLGGFSVQATEVPGSIYTHVCLEAALDDMWTLQLYKVP